MKKVTLITEMDVTDDFYLNEIVELKNDILSGKAQRDMMKTCKGKGMVKVKMTIKLNNKTN